MKGNGKWNEFIGNNGVLLIACVTMLGISLLLSRSIASCHCLYWTIVIISLILLILISVIAKPSPRLVKVMAVFAAIAILIFALLGWQSASYRSQDTYKKVEEVIAAIHTTSIKHKEIARDFKKVNGKIENDQSLVENLQNEIKYEQKNIIQPLDDIIGEFDPESLFIIKPHHDLLKQLNDKENKHLSDLKTALDKKEDVANLLNNIGDDLMRIAEEDIEIAFQMNGSPYLFRSDWFFSCREAFLVAFFTIAAYLLYKKVIKTPKPECCAVVFLISGFVLIVLGVLAEKCGGIIAKLFFPLPYVGGLLMSAAFSVMDYSDSLKLKQVDTTEKPNTGDSISACDRDTDKHKSNTSASTWLLIPLLFVGTVLAVAVTKRSCNKRH